MTCWFYNKYFWAVSSSRRFGDVMENTTPPADLITCRSLASQNWERCCEIKVIPVGIGLEEGVCGLRRTFPLDRFMLECDNAPIVFNSCTWRSASNTPP